MPLEGEYEPSPLAWVREQVAEYEGSGGTRATGAPIAPELPVVIVTTRGNKSGKLRKTPLMRVEHHGEYALVASNAGGPKNPVWYYNLVADPGAVTIQDGPAPFAVVVRQLDGAEKATWWERAVEAFPPYADYPANAGREIPVFLAMPA